jgi:hypothetical protein
MTSVITKEVKRVPDREVSEQQSRIFAALRGAKYTAGRVSYLFFIISLISLLVLTLHQCRPHMVQ